MKEERDGLPPWVVKTGHRMSIRGFVALILCLEPIPYHPIMYHQRSVIPVKRKLASDMERYERKVETKTRRVENCDRLTAASFF